MTAKAKRKRRAHRRRNVEPHHLDALVDKYIHAQKRAARKESKA